MPTTSDNVIQVEGISKRYRLGATVSHDTIREAITDKFRALTGRGPEGDRHAGAPEDFWALRDVNFSVREGEVIGVIGRNGAGKSTLLKILTRITDPTEGVARIRGRVASLLEVGTGFHPELTGRENIYLNGAILGMRKAEIKKKFDEIVAFAEIEKFLDTPVKRYSSGMYVRLAFAVAAHLEPEILLVDEVLAVGDMAFQKKCLGKMDDVSRAGRTILFVSHNMGAVRALCSRAMLLRDGRCVLDGDAGSVVDEYLYSGRREARGDGEVVWGEGPDAPGSEELRLRAVRLLSSDGLAGGSFPADREIRVEVEYSVTRPLRGLRVGVHILTREGETAFASTDHDSQPGSLDPGLYRSECVIPGGLLNTRTYLLRVGAGVPGVRVLLQPEEYLSFTVEGKGNHGSYFTEKWPGVVCPSLKWRVTKV